MKNGCHESVHLAISLVRYFFKLDLGPELAASDELKYLELKPGDCHVRCLGSQYAKDKGLMLIAYRF